VLSDVPSIRKICVPVTESGTRKFPPDASARATANAVFA